MTNDINITINSIPTYGYNLSRTSYDVRQEINSKVIGVLKYNNAIRKKILSRNIGKYNIVNNEDGIGYISNVYSLESSKPFSLGEDGLLGYTHIYNSDFQKSINQKYDIGDFIEYYKHGSLPESNNKKWNGLYNDYTEYIDEVYGFKYTSLNILQNLFNKNKINGTIDSETNLTIQSILYDILQYDNIKYAMEKSRIGTVNPNPLAALAGSVTTNINNFTGKDTSLGIISNHLYAHALHNGAKFNSLRNTNYITHEVYEFIGNKLSTLSTMSSDYRISDNTGRLAFEVGNKHRNTISYEDSSIDDIQKDVIDPTTDVFDSKNALYRNLIRNINHIDSFGNKHERYLPFQPYFNSKINKNGRIPESLNSILSQTTNDELNSLNEYVDNIGEDIISQKIYNNESVRYFNYLENRKKEGQTNRYLPFEGEQYDMFQYGKSTIKTLTIPTISNKVYYSWHEGDKGNWNNLSFSSYINNGFSDIKENDTLSNLQKKTQELFRSHNENGIDTLIGRYHTSGGRDVNHNEVSLMQTAVSKFGLSHGRNLLNYKAYSKQETTIDKSGYSNPYCRVWTYHNQYGKISDLIRPFSIKDENGNSSIKGVDELQKNYWKFGRVKGSAQRLKDNSVLNKNGLINITPINEGNSETDIDIKKCMFSIENLAWLDVDRENVLSNEQKGPNGGRIMWFPPYDLEFNETVGVEWNPTEFIGRGEKIYTYKNTERSGTLSFALLVDHPSVLDIWKKNNSSNIDDIDEQTLLRYFAGCEELEIDNISVNTIEPPVNPETSLLNIPVENNSIYDNNENDIIFYIFFPNYYTGMDDDFDDAIEYLKDYEINNVSYDDYKWNYRVDNKYIDKKLHIENNYKNEGYLSLNKNVFNGATISFNDIITSSITASIATVQGFASSHGYDDENYELAEKRALFAKKILREKLNIENVKELSHTIINVDNVDRNNVSSKSAKEARCVKVVIKPHSINFRPKTISDLTTENSTYNYYKPTIPIQVERPKMTKKQKRLKKRYERKNKDLIEKNKMESINESMNNRLNDSLNLMRNSSIEISTYSPNIEKIITDKISSDFKVGLGIKTEERINDTQKCRMDDEAQYFSMLKENDSFLYTRLIDKIKYFTPAFHSITPEGFNSRLSFLHQCTRQGFTNSVSDSNSSTITSAGNLAFGRPPVCVLRIGDFYNTKIIIESVTINYEKPQWDMNTEGIGMQPLYAKISLNFKFLGGSDLSSPISRLQNAITFNYYANQSIYDSRSDIGVYDGKKAKISGTPWMP